MALVKGTNCGFVAASPAGDPGGLGTPSNSGDAFAFRCTSPAGNNVITELGWWQGAGDNPAGNYNMGVYADDGGEPGSLITTQESGQATTPNTAEWCKYTGLSIPISPNTVYWIAVGIGPVGSDANYIDIAWDASELYRFEDTADETLSDPFVVDGGPTMLISIYAKYEAVPSILPLNADRMGSGCNTMRA